MTEHPKSDDSIELGEGTHYIFSRAYNEKGEKTDSPVSIVYVNGKGLEGAELTELEENRNSVL